jgi:hypothetical protein
MWYRTPLAWLSVGALLSGLSGCFLVSTPPPPPTGAEGAEQYSTMLERSWQSTGLSGLLDRPVVTSAAPIPVDGWPTVIIACMLEHGHDTTEFELKADGGFQLTAPVSSDVQLDFYLCLAQNPSSGVEGNVILTRAQLDYIYDYYASWLVPCIEHNGHIVREAPSREEFVAREGDWSPYDSFSVQDVSDFAALEELCGPGRPSLD